jgi:endonuclease/exonuclease/phosphatase family metal-dependent hydrolase
MFAQLMPLLSDYSYTGLTTHGNTSSGYYSAVVYNRNRFTLHESGTFWLSETPGVMSYGWDATGHLRICTWGRFTDKISGLGFYFFNAHLDHLGALARRESADLILRKMDTIAGTRPAVFTGDFNLDQFDSVYIRLNNSGKVKAAYDLAHDQQSSYQGTFNSFDTNAARSVSRIDHIFLSGPLKTNRYQVITDTYNGYRFPSDHFPVIANLELRQTTYSELYDAFPEDFERGSAKTNYAAGPCTLKTGLWQFDNAVLQNTANDAPSSGTFAARMLGGLSTPAYLQMLFDVPQGASKVVVWYSSYKASGDGPCKWILEYSTDAGLSWQHTGDTVTALEKTKQRVAFSLSVADPVRFRITKLGTGATNNGRLSIDDIAIYRGDTPQRSLQVPERLPAKGNPLLQIGQVRGNEVALSYASATAGAATISILDAAGRLLIRRQVQVLAGINSYTLNMSFPAGIYIATLQTSAHFTTLRFGMQ